MTRRIDGQLVKDLHLQLTVKEINILLSVLSKEYNRIRNSTAKFWTEETRLAAMQEVSDIRHKIVVAEMEERING